MDNSKASGKATLFLIIVAFLFFNACAQEVESQNDPMNKGFQLIELSENLIDNDTLLGADIYFGEFLHRSQQIGGTLLIADTKFCNLTLYHLEDKTYKQYVREDFPRFEQCMHSMTVSGDTTFLFYSHGLIALRILADTIYSINKFESANVDIHASHDLPISILSNHTILVPTAANIIKDKSYAVEMMAINSPEQFMQDQFLFSIFTNKGQLIKQFGKFPSVYQIPDLQQNSHRSYHYSITGDKVFIAFALTPLVQVYSLAGELLDELYFDLPEFEVLVESNTTFKTLNAIDGFAIEEIADGRYNYYFKTIHPSKRKQFFYKIDPKEQLTYEIPIFYPMGMMMSKVEDGEWLYMSMSWNDEPVVLKKYKF